MVRLDDDNDILLVGSNNWCITNSSSAIIFKNDLRRITYDSFPIKSGKNPFFYFLVCFHVKCLGEGKLFYLLF